MKLHSIYFFIYFFYGIGLRPIFVRNNVEWSTITRTRRNVSPQIESNESKRIVTKSVLREFINFWKLGQERKYEKNQHTLNSRLLHEINTMKMFTYRARLVGYRLRSQVFVFLQQSWNSENRASPSVKEIDRGGGGYIEKYRTPQSLKEKLCNTFLFTE